MRPPKVDTLFIKNCNTFVIRLRTTTRSECAAQFPLLLCNIYSFERYVHKSKRFGVSCAQRYSSWPQILEDWPRLRSSASCIYVKFFSVRSTSSWPSHNHGTLWAHNHTQAGDYASSPLYYYCYLCAFTTKWKNERKKEPTERTKTTKNQKNIYVQIFTWDMSRTIVETLTLWMFLGTECPEKHTAHVEKHMSARLEPSVSAISFRCFFTK